MEIEDLAKRVAVALMNKEFTMCTAEECTCGLVGATVAHLGKKHIDSIELIVPTNIELFIPFQKGFKQRQSLLSQIRLLTEARDRLLPKLMSGEINIE